MSEFLLVHLFNPIDKNKPQLPQHLKIVSWFQTTNVNLLINDLQGIANRQEPITTNVGGLAAVGASRTRRRAAHLLEKTPELHALHFSALDVVLRNGTLRSQKDVGDAFNPHVLQSGTSPMRPGKIVTIDSMTLLDSPVSNPRSSDFEVVQHYEFTDETQTGQAAS